MTRDLSLQEFRAALRSRGFRQSREGYVSHPEIAGGAPLSFSVLFRRQGLADLMVQLREARARKRGGRFVTEKNSNVRTRRMVNGSIWGAA